MPGLLAPGVYPARLVAIDHRVSRPQRHWMIVLTFELTHRENSGRELSLSFAPEHSPEHVVDAVMRAFDTNPRTFRTYPIRFIGRNVRVRIAPIELGVGRTTDVIRMIYPPLIGSARKDTMNADFSATR